MCVIHSFRYSRGWGPRNADEATLLSTRSPQHTCTVSGSLGIVLALSSRTPPSPPLSRPRRYHSGPASAFHCLPGASTVPGVWVRASGGGARYLIRAGTICPFLLFKQGTSEPSSPGESAQSRPKRHLRKR